MDASRAERIETIIERASSALFGAAVGYAANAVLVPIIAQPQRGALAAGGAAIAYMLSARALSAVAAAKPRHRVPIFDLRTLEPVPGDHPPLVDAADPPAAGPSADEPLVLDDILAQIGPDARVVRLFDASSMPTPGQLKARIDRHLDQEGGASASPDGAQALHDALAELRRSLR